MYVILDTNGFKEKINVIIQKNTKVYKELCSLE